MIRTTLRTLALASLLAVAACKSTPEEAPSDVGTIVRDAQTDTAADAQEDAQPDTAADAQPDTAADAQSDVTADAAADATADSSTDAATDAAADAGCIGDGGCFACTPTTSAQIITRCTGASCSHFDNATRLPRLLADGGVPPLP